MHPWKNIIIGKTEELESKACFICLERIPCSHGDMEEVKEHFIKVHSCKTHLEELVEMCIEAEEREEREEWRIDDILKEMRFRMKMPECMDNNEKAEIKEVDCFLCQLIVKSCEYRKHLEKQHGVIFGVKEIMKAGEKYILPNEEPNPEAEEAEPEVIIYN